MSLWLSLAVCRLMVCSAFIWLLLMYKPSGGLFDAYRAIAILFAIPTVFYIVSHTILGYYQLSSLSAAVGAGYAFLPFVLMAGLAIFPLTLLENAVMVVIILLAQAFAGALSWTVLNWPSFAGAFWLLMLIGAVTSMAGMSQLAFMIALIRQAIRDPLTGVFPAAVAKRSSSFNGKVRSGRTVHWRSPSSIWITSRRLMTPLDTKPGIAP